MSTNSNTAPMPTGNGRPDDYQKADRTKADAAKPDRDSRSLLKNLPVGALKPANAK
ncbi:hypothetical protein AWB69_05984 [Caballeronia udeis]|uniref:Uncharacterized protein n=1 Tax=Caballeronia udeis TaxID=1232866 RepID=A0A158IGG7_9BURK|nr:hypothetical protein [Caballeronia udeis]SAL55668.1 hypothetical protein AWB69_05984 [Caballeronia udeis]